MIVIPLIYFTALAAYFYIKERSWGMDIAATTLLIAISIGAIMIEVNDIYDEYGINEYSITFPTIMLFCLQWTLVLIPVHYISRLPIEEHFPIKKPMLYAIMIVVALSSMAVIASKLGDIREALVMDMIDVKHEHYKDLVAGRGEESSIWLFLPTILVSTPFPTLALFLWFYTKSFTNTPFLLRFGILLASIVQAITAIITAGRSAIVYWIFDFYLLYSLFYRYLSVKAKRSINTAAAVMMLLIGTLFMSITISRFDEAGSQSTPLNSIWGYAGQHINNFCAMINYGGETDFLPDRIFPFTSRLMGHPYDMVGHYEDLRKGINMLVNVFDTFGGEIYLDLGWIGYILFFVFWIIMTLYLKSSWHEIPFHRVFPVIILIAFFTRGLFAWPFTGHVTTIALALVLANSYFFKYTFKI